MSDDRGSQTVQRDEKSTLEDMRVFVESRFIEPAFERKKTPPTRMSLAQDANQNPLIRRFDISTEENTLRWLADGSDFVRYTGVSFRREQIIVDIGRIDVRFFFEGGAPPFGQYMYEIGYSTLQTGAAMCQTHPHWGFPRVELYLYHESEAYLGKMTMSLVVPGGHEKRPTTGPQVLVSQTPTPEAILRDTYTILASFPSAFNTYMYRGK